ncbi:MAG: DJ-1/PfpI family protein [Deltaproteobacteria bacterium]|nr:DJ-1/PfpI family protein [Deltaproteobacteria bacterium]
MKKVLIPLADGFEEIEALATVDILRRAGADVTVAGTLDGPITGRSSIRVIPDISLDLVQGLEFDMIVLPGGAGGTEVLKKDIRVAKLIKDTLASKGFVSAICAATTILNELGVLEGRKFTAHPSVFSKLGEGLDTLSRVVVDNNIITSQGPGTAIEFALTLVKVLFGEAKALNVNKGVMAKL